MDLDLSGKRALVTGSTRGIGLASAIGLARMGAELVVHGRGEDTVAAAIGRIRQEVSGAKLQGVAADIGNAEGCADLIRAVPQVDILVNNMGVYEFKPFFELEDDDWHAAFEINVLSGVRLTRHYLKRMLDGDWGRVVFVSSDAAVLVSKEMVHYGFSKAAQLLIARGAAEQTVGTNVTVNAVLPGPTWVERQSERMAARAASLGTTVEDLKERTFTERRPSSLLQRFAAPEEIANMICYICSKASSATNGAALRADGGIVTNPF